MAASKHRVVILICYYGEFPWYFKHFLHSCKFNKDIDFILFSDIVNTKVALPENVSIIKKPLNEINKLISEKLGFKTIIDLPYKLCDFKPVYGLTFSEFITGYDFWGYCDIDLIYGNIRNFMTDEVLDEFDFISARHDYTTGCFALYRNNDIMNNCFKRSKDYKKIFLNSRLFRFDECNFANSFLAEGGSIFDSQTEIESLTHIIQSAVQQKIIKAHFEFIMLGGAPGNIKFNNGRLIYRNEYEVMLYHLYWLKRIYNPGLLKRKIPDSYCVSSTCIYV